MYWLKVIFYSIILTLAGCGGDSAPNDNNSGGSDGGGTEVHASNHSTKLKEHSGDGFSFDI